MKIGFESWPAIGAFDVLALLGYDQWALVERLQPAIVVIKQNEDQYLNHLHSANKSMPNPTFTVLGW